ncbi:heavy metal translocating P-type ATPase [Candidatus Enterococcus leclercqii]|uniref:heavy metal translocating P-type ATPase n=1 Tax=Candidatus Enterococcus leclercqii TaxID=1857218 RepID=UPI001379B706|nr:heavy metal translocating P-type ATPase [Enterococcus sp. CU9D]KAF1291863.1 cadmium-translocating P-type ATPase [Enterococcus sp. CU9D]
MEKSYYLKGLDCANCAAKIERAVTKVDGVKTANVDFMSQKMSITCEQENLPTVEAQAYKLIGQLEPDVAVVPTESEGLQNEHSHGHTHDHQHSGGENGNLWRIIVTGLALALLLWLNPTGLPRVIAYVVVYALIGGDIVKNAVMNIFHGEVFDENFLMTVATIGALAIGEFPEAVAVMFLYQIGEYFQDFAVDRSRKNIRELMDVRPDFARLLADGVEKEVSPSAVEVGSLIVVNPGEKIPLDGLIEEGSSSVDTSALTGESMPRQLATGDEILSGMINQDGRLVIKTSRSYGQSTVSKILELVENASSQKAPAEKFITKFARYYTPAVVGLAVLLVAIPTLFLGGDFKEWLYRALTFLVISCPCALVISVPLSFFAGIGGAGKAGILVKGSNHLETLANVDTVVFDKTGTLTAGKFAVESVSGPLPTQEILYYAAALEQHSSHPIAQSVMQAAASESVASVADLKEVAGHGITGVVDGKLAAIGNQKLMQMLGVTYPENDAVGTVLYLAINGNYAGLLVINDQIKSDAKEAITGLQAAGVKETIMLTGDSPKVAAAVSQKLGLSRFFAGLLPEDKVSHLKEIMAQSVGKVAFVGDGINDAPVLVTADLGVAMGGLGSDAAIEAADIVIMNDQPSKLTQGIKISRKTLKIVKENILFALGVKAVVLVLGALGYTSMAVAVFADVGVTLLAVLNAMRCLRVK